MMKSLLIGGAVVYDKIVKEIAEECGFTRVNFLDDANSVSVGKLCDIENHKKNYTYCDVAIGSLDLRKKLIIHTQKPATISYPKATVSKSASIGDHCAIEANAVIKANANVENASYMCDGGVINHDAHDGRFAKLTVMRP